MNKGGGEPQVSRNNETSFEDVFLWNEFYEQDEQATLLQSSVLACIAGVPVSPAPTPLRQVGQLQGREHFVSADVRKVRAQGSSRVHARKAAPLR